MNDRSDALLIRVPELGDMEELARLFHQDMTELGVATSLEEKRQFAAALLEALAVKPKPRCLCWVVEDGERLVGVLLANFHWSVKFAGRSLWIESLYVDPAGRRRGVGRALVDYLLDWAYEHEIRGVDIEAYHGNTPASVLYRTMGFRRLGRERFNYQFDVDGEA